MVGQSAAPKYAFVHAHMSAVILVDAQDSMAGESVYGPHDYLVGEGADIVEAGGPAFYAVICSAMSYRLHIEAYAGRWLCIGFTCAINRSPKPDVGW
jgi:hypothetical protein